MLLSVVLNFLTVDLYYLYKEKEKPQGLGFFFLSTYLKQQAYTLRSHAVVGSVCSTPFTPSPYFFLP
jgi:hypothetical protein